MSIWGSHQYIQSDFRAQYDPQILGHILGKHELSYTNDLVEISCRSLKAFEQNGSFPVSIESHLRKV